MDAFTGSELFDDDAPCAPLPQTDESTGPLTVIRQRILATARCGRAGPLCVCGRCAGVAVLVVAALALRVGRSSPERNPRRGTVRSHHVRSHAPRPRQRVVTRRRAVEGRVAVPLVAAKVVVRMPNSGPEHPSRSEGVGIGRPVSAPTIGNTEQFGYLGR